MTQERIKEALDELYVEAKCCLDRGEIPVSAALLFEDRTEIISSNQVEQNDDPFAHAEFNVIQEALKQRHTRYLKEATLIVTLEPCLLCLGAILKTGIPDLYYVLDDPKLGSLSHYHAFVDDKLHVHQIQDERFQALIDTFFSRLRS